MEAEVIGEHGYPFLFFQYLLFACLQSRNSEHGSTDKYNIKSVRSKDLGQVINLFRETTVRMNLVKSSSKYDKRNV